MQFTSVQRLPAGMPVGYRRANTATPHRPQANCYAERWIGSARRECLDQLLILGERHLQRVLTAYADFYNQRRPHQRLSQRCPLPLALGPGQGPIVRHDVRGGIIHDYEHQKIA